MSSKDIFLAVDLGAGSGRVLAAHYNGSSITLDELHRFENKAIEVNNSCHWDFDLIISNIKDGLKIAAQKYGERVASIGIDTWGVDYGLLDREGTLLNTPFQYRDPRTDGMMEKTFEKVEKSEIYEATGIQFMFFNTLFQMMAEVNSEHTSISRAENLLFMPDLVGYMLTGQKTQERSIASTSQLYNPIKGDWDKELIQKLGLPEKIFSRITDPGSVLGNLSEAVASETGLKDVVVVTVAGHDTASAVVGVPSEQKKPIFLSSGTWSLMGIELPKPVINRQSFIEEFTNEIGAGNTVRFLKNISGLWLIQQSRDAWLKQGDDIPYSDMAHLAQEAEPFRSLINPDDPSFTAAGDMPRRIQDFCWNTRQLIPETKGQIIRCIYESLALKYATVWKSLVQYTSDNPPMLHIVGGGSQDVLLNQMTANAIGAPVMAGPTEATGLGNAIIQMLAFEKIGSIAEGRKIVKNSYTYKTFMPENPEAWRKARETFNSVQHIHPNL